MLRDQKWLISYEGEFRNKNVLEVGSGLGWDTKELLKYTNTITSLEIDEKRVKKLKLDMPHINIYCIDIRMDLPFPSYTFDTVLASLSLHYFTFIETEAILRELKRVLKNNSNMIVRLNSINDSNYGAIGYPEIEHHLFDVEGRYKRFFDEADIFSIFEDGWEINNLVEKSIDRFDYPKIVWEFTAKNI